MMEVRLLTSEDAIIYKEIRLEALKNHPEAFGSSYEEESNYPLERFQGRFNQENSFTFGAFIDHKLIGVVTLIKQTRRKMSHRADIVAMFVRADYRKSGIGKRLMSEAIALAKELNTEQVYIAVTSINEAAKRLYLSLGFKTYGIDYRALKFDDTYYDEELMVLKL